MSVLEVPISSFDELRRLFPEPPPSPVSEDDYYRWSERHGYLRAEWIDGEISYMAPSGPVHDDLAWWIGTLLRIFVERKGTGRVKMDTWTKFQLPEPQVRGPDVAFIKQSRVHIITKQNVSEPPDFIIEIVSPGDESRDYRDKYLIYEASGVHEYWIIDPASRSIESYRLGKNGKYARYYEKDGKLTIESVPDWYVKPIWLWQDPRPNVLDILTELGVR